MEINKNFFDHSTVHSIILDLHPTIVQLKNRKTMRMANE